MVRKQYVETLWRRKWLFVIPLVGGIVAGYIACCILPPSYRSSTLIFVEPQKVPSTPVNPPVSGIVDDRLWTISQQILSRTHLAKIIKEYKLYTPEQDTPTKRHDLLGRIQDKARQSLTKYGFARVEVSTPLHQDEVPEEVVDRMRKDIEVRVTSKEAFSVAYNGTEPDTVMRVTHTLALLFLEANLPVQAGQAEGTSEFLESQLSEAQKELQRQELNLREFQQRNQGALSAQLEMNLRALDKLQQELNSLNDLIKSGEMALTESRKAAEERKNQQPDPVVPISKVQQELPRPPAADPRLETLKQDLSRLRVTFRENYPDIVLIKKQIEELEAGQASDSSALPGGPAPGTSAPFTGPQTRTTSTPPATRGASLPGTLGLPRGTEKIERELATLRARREKIMAQAQKLEEYVNATPANEAKLTELTRDYEMSRKNYQSLVDQRLQAKISENREKQQQGEQFRIIEPANFPTTPVSPNRPFIISAGGAVGGGLGIGLILLVNFFKPALRQAEDVSGVSGVPVLVTIPRYHTHVGKDHHVVVLQESASLIAEQYRILYTRINDLSKNNPQQILAITSAMHNEGKTVTALNLAVVMARDFGKKTLVLEGDVRRPTIPLYLKVELEEGLVDILSSKSDFQSTMVPIANTLIPFADDNLAVLPAGPRIQRSTSLLSVPRVRELCDALREQYDCILIDAPPVLPLSDMRVFAEVVDGIIMVVRAENTLRDVVTKALDTVGADKVLGIVLNDVRQRPFSYYRYNEKYDCKPGMN